MPITLLGPSNWTQNPFNIIKIRRRKSQINTLRGPLAFPRPSSPCTVATSNQKFTAVACECLWAWGLPSAGSRGPTRQYSRQHRVSRNVFCGTPGYPRSQQLVASALCHVSRAELNRAEPSRAESSLSDTIDDCQNGGVSKKLTMCRRNRSSARRKQTPRLYSPESWSWCTESSRSRCGPQMRDVTINPSKTINYLLPWRRF